MVAICLFVVQQCPVCWLIYFIYMIYFVYIQLMSAVVCEPRWRRCAWLTVHGCQIHFISFFYWKALSSTMLLLKCSVNKVGLDFKIKVELIVTYYKECF